MKKAHVSVAIGGLAGILALWALSSRARVPELPNISKGPKSAARSLLPGEVPEPPFLGRVPSPDRLMSQHLQRTGPFPSQANPGPETKPRAGAWDHWGYLRRVPSGAGEAGREQAIRATADYLSVEGASLPAFLEAARVSSLELGQALTAREAELKALGPPGDSSSGNGEGARQSEQRYATARERALGRMEPYLGHSPRDEDFRWGFDSWASTVAGKVGGGVR